MKTNQVTNDLQSTLNELNERVFRTEGISALMAMVCQILGAGADALEPYTAALYLIGELATENAEKLNAINDKLVELRESEVES